jgi:hypothetical protein
VAEIIPPLPDELEALRRVQLAGLRRFLLAVLATRQELGLSLPQGTLDQQADFNPREVMGDESTT